MAYSLDKDWSVDSTTEYCVAMLAALLAVDELAELAPPVMAFIERCDAAIAARNKARRQSVVASAKVRVLDVANDKHIGLLSGTAFLAAGKEAKNEPYNALFGTTPAKDLQKMGPHKVTTAGASLVKKLKEQNHPQLTPLVPAFEASLEKLKTAGEARSAAFIDEGTHDVVRRRLIDEAEKLGADIEVGILTKFPGRKDLVRAVLAPERDNARKAEEAEDGEVPDNG